MSALRCPVWVAAFVVCSLPLSAQGVAGSSIQGRVTALNGTAIESAIITVTNEVNGALSRTTSRSTGAFSIENLTVGGPYLIDVKAIGFDPADRADVFLSLGQRLSIDFRLARSVTTLAALVVRPDRATSTNSVGAVIISDSTIRALPVRERDVFQMSLLSPQAVRTRGGGLSLAGQPDRLNGLQIDGATNNDLLGNSTLGLIGTPGQNLGARTLSPDAVDQLEIVTAPFDVRFGNFAAGLVNAVTRSGTNRFSTTISSWYSGPRLAQNDSEGGAAADYETRELNITAGGPIVRDRLAYFVDAGLQRMLLPQSVPLIRADTAGGRDSAQVGIRYESVARLIDILSKKYGVDAGTAAPFPVLGKPRNLFAKLTWQPRVNYYLELSQNYASNNPVVLTFAPLFSCRFRGLFCLSSRSFRIPVTVDATRFAWIGSIRSGVENELRIARLDERNRCVPATTYPAVVVAADQGWLAAGSADFCQGDLTRQQIMEMTDNLTVTRGAHRLTVGAHGERVRIPNVDGVQFLFHTGWTFESLDSLAAALPSGFESIFRNPTRGDEPLSNLGITQIGFYAQDHWNVASHFELTAGMRVDVPYLDRRPARNAELGSTLGIDNTLTPSGNILVSPRVSWTFPFSAKRSAVLRGGAGIFAGRPPYKWFDQVYGHTGLEALAVSCTGSSVPLFTLDPDRQPTSCSGSAPFVPYVNVFDPHFRFPRNLKVGIGADVQLKAGLTINLDFLESLALDQLALRDLNLESPIGTSAGEARRTLYGTIDVASGIATPSRRNGSFGSVIQLRNDHGDRASVLSLQLIKQVATTGELRVSYAHTVSRDRFSATEDAADANIGAVPVAGSLERRRLTDASWSVPQKIAIDAVFRFPLGFGAAVNYIGTSGLPFTYVIRGDANADGFGDQFSGRNFFNDAVYVPKSSNDITLQNTAQYEQLERFINAEDCLSQSRGRILNRNSCRNEWANLLDVRVSKRFTASQLGSVEIISDVFNLFSLVGSKLGQLREAEGGGEVPLLELTGYDAHASRGIYSLIPVDRRAVSSNLSRWRIQLGVRLSR
ncbi:MAG TPA: carboxypeptidase regulatory-like domain-containing protein [Gemmatimonadaceae bacterium]